MKNQERLEKNRPPREATVLSGPPREGLALLQGLLLCGQCGRGCGSTTGASVIFLLSINVSGGIAKGLPGRA
jgi:hypothetical protein